MQGGLQGRRPESAGDSSSKQAMNLGRSSALATIRSSSIQTLCMYNVLEQTIAADFCSCVCTMLLLTAASHVMEMQGHIAYLWCLCADRGA